jgi:hypothetical protein
MLFLMFSSLKANAQSCGTVYNGCTDCVYAQYVVIWDPWTGQYRQDFVSGSEWWCWTNASVPYPSANIEVWNPDAGGYTGVTCQAYFPLVPQQVNGPPQPADPNQQNVYRFFHSSSKDHILTLSYCEGAAFATYEGIGFKTLKTQLDADMRELYRCYASAPSDHLVSTDPNCEGLTFEGSYGWVSTIPRTGYVPLYRIYMPNWHNHLATTNAAEGAGLVNEGILGYVPQ